MTYCPIPSERCVEINYLKIFLFQKKEVEGNSKIDKEA